MSRLQKAYLSPASRRRGGGTPPAAPMFAMLAALLMVLAGCGRIHQQTVGEDGSAFFGHGPQLLSGGNDAEALAR